MSRNDNANPPMPPSKRPRLMQMVPPDGFAKPNTKPKSAQKASAPHFTSAFDKPSFKPESKSISKPSHRVSAQIFKQEVPKRQPVAKPRPVLRALKPPSLATSASRNSREGASSNKSSMLLASLHPNLTDISPANDPPLRSARPPVFAATITSVPPAKPLKHIAPPLPPPPVVSSSRPLFKSLKEHAPLQPPLLPAAAPISDKEMRTITTTHIALATNLSTDSGVAELASIFLHDQHPNIVPGPSIDPGAAQHHSGLYLSQDTVTTGKGPKFIRNGFAARASNLFDRSRTSMLLWQKEAEHRSGRRSAPDMCLRIVKILHIPDVLPTSPSPGIALCQRQSSNFSTTCHNHPLHTEELLLVLFSFPSATTQSAMRDPMQFTEGRIIHVWAPWQEMSLSTCPALSLDSSEDLEVSVHIPASLPLPSSDNSAPGTSTKLLPVSDIALFCFRFLLYPTSSA